MKLTVAALATLGAASAAQLKSAAKGAEVIPDEYIVVLKPTASVESLKKIAAACYSKGVWKHALMGFPARLNSEELAEVLKLDEVDYVEPDTIMYALGARNSTLDESNAACSDTQTGKQSWGQSRTTRTKGTGNYEHEKTWGKNVKVYVIDTGSNCNHEDFNAACSCGPTFAGGSNGCSDGNGHGTHCASTATGTVYGISKNAELVGVKVLSDRGSGSTSGVVAGMDWVASQGSGSVASMSLGGGYSLASNNAVDGMTRAGVTVVVAAGNDGRDACNYSPASASTAYTIGATTQRDARSSFSNIGKCVDIFAPGSSITAAWYKPGQTNTISGTSMACPHVAGAAAAILSENPRFTPAEVKSALDNLALTGVISNVGRNSPNKFLHLEC